MPYVKLHRASKVYISKQIVQKFITLDMSDQMVYIKHAHIEGFKSLLNSDVTFSSGLNIIIGKNGAGKSNLLDLISGVLLENVKAIGPVEARIDLQTSKADIVSYEANFKNGVVTLNTPKEEHRFANSDRRIFEDPKSDNKENQPLPNEDLAELVMISHAVPVGIPFLDLELNFRISNSSADLQDLWKIMVDPNLPYFSRATVARIFSVLVLKIEPKWVDIQTELHDLFTSALLDVGGTLVENLREFTTIKDLRLSKWFSAKPIGKESAVLSNISYEFKVGENWIPYSNLSDGTKRMVYIIFSISMPRLFSPNSTGVSISKNESPPKIILLEEPELGIHPHQLHLLLLFLREQAKTQQIIITTHSPQVLDILNNNELDRIIVASYDALKGSAFIHLNQAEKDKAYAYMEELRLSDYWLYSDLETSFAS